MSGAETRSTAVLWCICALAFLLLLSGCAHDVNVFDLMERGNLGHYPQVQVTPPPELSNCEVLGRDGVWRSCM